MTASAEEERPSVFSQCLRRMVFPLSGQSLANTSGRFGIVNSEMMADERIRIAMIGNTTRTIPEYVAVNPGFESSACLIRLQNSAMSVVTFKVDWTHYTTYMRKMTGCGRVHGFTGLGPGFRRVDSSGVGVLNLVPGWLILQEEES